MRVFRPVFALRLAVMLALGLLLLGSAGTSAQDATPGATPMVGDVPPLTAAVYQGTCEDIGELVFDLGELGLATEMDDDEELRGTVPDSPILQVNADWDGLNFDALLDEAVHAIVIHDDTDARVACGDIGGPVDDDELNVAIRPLNDGGYAGIAHIEEDEAALGIGDDEIEIELYLFAL